MKAPLFLITSILFLFACNKQDSSIGSPDGGNPANGTAGGGSGSGSSAKGGKAASSITVLVDGVSIPVTSISFNRGTGNFNFSAGNTLQKVDAYCFWFYGTSGFNYQYSDSLTYSTRVDSAGAWNTMKAIGYGTVDFDCCSFPVKDSVVDGTYSGKFSTGKLELTVNGRFHYIYP